MPILLPPGSMVISKELNTNKDDLVDLSQPVFSSFSQSSNSQTSVTQTESQPISENLNSQSSISQSSQNFAVSQIYVLDI